MGKVSETTPLTCEARNGVPASMPYMVDDEPVQLAFQIEDSSEFV